MRLTNSGVRGPAPALRRLGRAPRPSARLRRPGADRGQQGAHPRGAALGPSLDARTASSSGPPHDRATSSTSTGRRSAGPRSAAIAAERGLAIERLPAVDGRDPAALAASSAAPGSGLRPGRDRLLREPSRAPGGGSPTATRPFGLVLEDDVFLGPALAEVLAALPAAAEGLDIVKLNAHPRGMLVAHAAARRVAGRAPAASGAGHQRLRAPTSSPGASPGGRWRSTTATPQPLDLALFDPATGPAIAQLDPAVTIQQRYADFRFLDEGAPKTSIQPDRAATAAPAGPSAGGGAARGGPRLAAPGHPGGAAAAEPRPRAGGPAGRSGGSRFDG